MDCKDCGAPPEVGHSVECRISNNTKTLRLKVIENIEGELKFLLLFSEQIKQRNGDVVWQLACIENFHKHFEKLSIEVEWMKKIIF